MERCEECGFAWETVGRDEIASRVLAGTAAIVELLGGAPELVGVQPAPGRWSGMEYAAHVRDVMLTLRDRLVVGIVEDLPGFKPMYRDERITLGLYRADTPEAVSAELRAAAAMFVRLFEAIDPDLLGREVMYGAPEPVRRSLLWMGQQVVHEVEHHGSDIVDNLRLVGDSNVRG